MGNNACEFLTQTQRYKKSSPVRIRVRITFLQSTDYFLAFFFVVFFTVFLTAFFTVFFAFFTVFFTAFLTVFLTVFLAAAFFFLATGICPPHHKKNLPNIDFLCKKIKI